MRYSNLGNEFFDLSSKYIEELFKDSIFYKEENIYCISTQLSVSNINRYINYLGEKEIIYIEQTGILVNFTKKSKSKKNTKIALNNLFDDNGYKMIKCFFENS